MPERIASNLSAIAKWKDEIELAVVFWVIGATIGVGQHLLSASGRRKNRRLLITTGGRMENNVIDLGKWREEHPPIARLACMNGRLLMAAFAFQRAAVLAWLSLLVVRR